LRGLGVDQLHCLILRGPNGAVIRRWSPDTRLNGRTFTKAPLSAGDRLSVGCLELEVVATGEIAAPSPGADAFYTDQYQEYPTPAESRKDSKLESEQLDARKCQLLQEEESLDLRAKQLEDTATALRAEQNKFEEERRQWEYLHNASLSAESRQLDARKSQLLQEKISLDLLTKQLEETATKLRAEQNKFEEERRQWEDLHNASLSAESQQRAVAEEEQLARLNAQRAELESQRQTWILRQQQWQAEQELSQRQLRDRQRQFDERKVELDAQAAELENKAAELKKQSAELLAQSADLQTRTAAVDSMRSKFETECNRWEEACRAMEKTLASREEEADQKAAQLETLQARFQAEKQNWEQQLARQQRDRQLWEAQRTEQAASEELSPTGKAPAVEASRPPQTDKSPEDSDDFRRRLGHDTDKPEKTDSSAADETTDGGSSQHAPAHEEESVDDYMARLMQRIRGTQGELISGADNPYASTSSQRNTAPSPLEMAPSPPAAPIPILAQRGEPVELLPHAVAPEKQVDITVLRDLAKYSVQNALGTYARRQMMRVMYSKLAVALLGGFIGLGLLCVWQMWFPSNLTFFSAMMSFVVAIIWGAQYVLLTIQLLASGSVKLDSIQTFHSKDKERKTPSEHGAISGIAGKDYDGKDEG
jgi:hypothetical protein